MYKDKKDKKCSEDNVIGKTICQSKTFRFF